MMAGLVVMKDWFHWFLPIVMAVRREPKRDVELEHLPNGGARLHNERPRPKPHKDDGVVTNHDSFK